jgi:hypothetical protein
LLPNPTRGLSSVSSESISISKKELIVDEMENDRIERSKQINMPNACPFFPIT